MASNAHGREPSRLANLVEGVRSDEPRAEEKHPSPSRSLSVIGPTLVLKGELVAEEDLLIQGRVEGSIHHRAMNLTIGAHGEVAADIVGQNVIIQGSVHGDVRASDSVAIEASARVEGNLFAPRIGLKEGAKFKGAIDMEVAAQEPGRGVSTHGVPSHRGPSHSVPPQGETRSSTAADSREAAELEAGKVAELLESPGSQ